MTRARQMASAHREIESRSVWETCRALLSSTPEDHAQWAAEKLIADRKIQAGMDAAIARHRAKETGQ